MVQDPTGPAPGRRVPALDGIRGIAIAAVLLFHTNLLADRGAPLDAAVSGVFGFGWAGVDIFFVLSGFLITGILIDTRGERRYFSRFYVRRALRIVPVYYVLLLVLFSLARVAYPPSWSGKLLAPQLWYWSYLTNWWFAQSNGRALFNSGHLWSLAIEEQFYLIWPLVVVVATRTSTRALRVLCVGIVILSPLVRWLLLHDGVGPYTVYLATFTRLDGLAAGAWVACIARESTTGLVSFRPAARWMVIVGGAAALSIAVVQRSPSVLQISMLVAGLSAIICAAAGWMVLVCTDPPKAVQQRVLSHPWLRSLGTHSYSIYLVHYPVILLLRTQGARWLDAVPRVGTSDVPRQLVLLVAVTAATYAVARVTWLLVESPVLRLKRLVPYEGETANTKAPALSTA